VLVAEKDSQSEEKDFGKHLNLATLNDNGPQVYAGKGEGKPSPLEKE